MRASLIEYTLYFFFFKGPVAFNFPCLRARIIHTHTLPIYLLKKVPSVNRRRQQCDFFFMEAREKPFIYVYDSVYVRESHFCVFFFFFCLGRAVAIGTRKPRRRKRESFPAGPMTRADNRRVFIFSMKLLSERCGENNQSVCFILLLSYCNLLVCVCNLFYFFFRFSPLRGWRLKSQAKNGRLVSAAPMLTLPIPKSTCRRAKFDNLWSSKVFRNIKFFFQNRVYITYWQF